MKPASSAADGAPTRHWEKRVLYAYLRMMGATQTHAARAVGRAERTGQMWEEDKGTYLQAREEARKRWLGELTDAARVALLTTIQGGDGHLALQLLERLDSDLAPAKHRQALTLDGGGLASLLAAARGTSDGHPAD
jgi:hypothetical protein